MMARGFEKITFLRFCEDTFLDKDSYDSYLLPRRSTKNSAGYDFMALSDIVLEPSSTVLISTGVKAFMEDDEVLMIFIRSSLGFKYNLRLCNQVGIIDSDYYNNSGNEGHIFVKIKNEGSETVTIKRGENVVQGIFTKFLTVSDEVTVTSSRKGGFGSTDKEENL